MDAEASAWHNSERQIHLCRYLRFQFSKECSGVGIDSHKPEPCSRDGQAKLPDHAENGLRVRHWLMENRSQGGMDNESRGRALQNAPSHEEFQYLRTVRIKATALVPVAQDRD